MKDEATKVIESIEEDYPTPEPVPEPSVFAAATRKDLVRQLFKNDWGLPFELTDGQEEIFDSIFMKGANVGKRRVHIMTHTQYGKSDTVAMATLLRAATFPEKWAIIAPSVVKAKIIMAYVIKHLFENEYTMSRFLPEKGDNMKNIRKERSKNRLTFDLGNGQIGEIFILSAESKIKSDDVGNALMGFGAPNVIEDEAGLISDESDAKATRMVGGYTKVGLDFIVKIGNPFKRNHFLKAYHDPAYHKINIDYKRSILEGRLTKEFVEEMRSKPFFGVMYENRFPSENDIDRKGWTQLFPDHLIERAMDWVEEPKHVGEKRLGNDVARGGANQSTWTLRSMMYLQLLMKGNQSDLNDVAAQNIHLADTHKVLDANIFVDDNGVGGGVTDIMRREQKKITPVIAQAKAQDQAKFSNVRAECYWRFYEWLARGGKLSKDDDWYSLTNIKYKPNSRGQLRVMGKDEMRAQGIDSPDVADGGSLTFYRKEHSSITKEKERRERKREKRERVRGNGLAVTMGGYGSG